MSIGHYPQGLCVPATGGVNPFGTTWYVAATGYGSNGAEGKSPDKPLNTIQKALDLGSAGDVIVLAPGTHNVDVSSAALAPLADMQFVAAIPPMGGKPSTIITHDADDGVNLFTVDVDGVGFHGIEFKMVAGGTTAVQLFDIAQTTAVNGVLFEDCWFNLNSVDKAGKVIALTIDDATNATTGMVVRNCRFTGGDATTGASVYIDVGVGGIPGALIEHNIFELESADGDAVALNFADPGAGGKCYAFSVRNNDFVGPKDKGADAVPIVFAAAGDEDEIVCIIRTNYFSNCSATPVTQDEVNGSLVLNYVGDDATGGTLVDPGS
jgi:hypothetical protein